MTLASLLLGVFALTAAFRASLLGLAIVVFSAPWFFQIEHFGELV
jgi:hypothetical protein